MTINTFSIRNFRTFDYLCLENLKRVNLIAGDNNTGKTALLEALWQFSAPDQPDIGWRLARFRGLDQVEQNQPSLDLFHGYSAESPIEMMAMRENDKEPSSLRISLQPREVSLTRLESGEGDSSPHRLITESRYVLLLNFESEGIQTQSSGWFVLRETAPGILQSGLEMQRPQSNDRPSSHLFAPRHRNPAMDDANKFGRIQLDGHEDAIVEAVKQFEPRLKRLVSIPVNGESILHVDVGLQRPVPAALLGDGIQRFLSVALAFANAKGGLILLDEVENGIHYSKLPVLWRAIAQFAEEFNVQVFATTHSDQCVRAAHETFSKLELTHLGFFRLDRVNGKIVAKSFDQDMLETAIEHNFEVR